MFKIKVVSAAAGAAFIIGGLAAWAQPRQNVSGARHPNLAAAQRLSEQAYMRITDAQQANEFDLAGHAAKAKELLDQVNKELKLAAEQANRNKAK
jgi:hypothetical protein